VDSPGAGTEAAIRLLRGHRRGAAGGPRHITGRHFTDGPPSGTLLEDERHGGSRGATRAQSARDVNVLESRLVGLCVLPDVAGYGRESDDPWIGGRAGAEVGRSTQTPIAASLRSNPGDVRTPDCSTRSQAFAKANGVKPACQRQLRGRLPQRNGAGHHLTRTWASWPHVESICEVG